MRFFWKALLLVLPVGVGGYLLYKKSGPPADTKVESEQKEENKATSEAIYRKDAEAKQGEEDREKQENELSTGKIIEQLTNIDGVTSRVAENLVERGITSKEALLKLSEEELKSVKGIGPKRAAKILNLK